jgi:tubby-related protein 1
MIQCTIKRDKSGMARFYPKYHMHLSNGFKYLMSAKKRACNNTSNYLVTMNRNDFSKGGGGFLGKVRSNFLGTEFVLYDNGNDPKKVRSSD